MPKEDPVCRMARIEQHNDGFIKADDLNEEVFLYYPDRHICTVLPGPVFPLTGTETGIIRIHRGMLVSGAAGAGDISWANAETIGGWCAFTCLLLSPRRFAARQGGALMNGQNTADILTDTVRGALRDGFQAANPAMSRRQIWQQVRQAASDRLMDFGWQMSFFRPESLTISRRNETWKKH